MTTDLPRTAELSASDVSQPLNRLGFALVAASAITWSFGGPIARFLTVGDDWCVIFWRSVFAAGFLLAFMLVRDGPRGTLALARGMGLAGIVVGLCFTVASTCFVLALAHTTVANILLLLAGVPLFAALLSWTLFREAVSRPTWLAIAAAICGVAIMMSDSLSGDVSVAGDGLALLIAMALAVATVVTRRHSNVRMTPAVLFGTLVAAAISFAFAGGLTVGNRDLALLFVFGALNLGLGLAFFVTGARLIPSAVAALLGVLETVFGPIWMWLIHAEIPTTRTMVGGGLVFLALLAHQGYEWRRQRTRAAVARRPANADRAPTPGVPPLS